MAHQGDELAENTQETALKRVIGTPFQPGNPGKLKGTTNHLTRTVKEAVLDAFNKLQEDEKNNLSAFAAKYPRDFYAIAAKLIPTDIRADVRLTQVNLKIVRANDRTETEQSAPTAGESGE